jgi:hypothetical protein
MALPDLFIPPWLRISGGNLGYQSNTAASESIFTQAVRTLDRTGDKVRTSFRTDNASHRETDPTRAFLESFRARLRGQASRVWFGDPAYVQRGSFPASELIANNTFGSGTTGWTTSSANITTAVTDRVLRSTRASVSADETIRAAVATTVSGATYIARVMAFAGRGSMDFRIRLGTTAGGSELAASAADITSGGLATLTAVATGTSTFLSILDGVSGRAIGNYMDFVYVSLTRCALVNGASQTGSSITIDALPVSTSGLARIGDWVQIGNQPCKVVQSLDSDSSGVGLLHLAYPPRTTPADNAPVIFNQPMGRFVAVSNEGGAEYVPGGLSSHDFEFVEALDS